MDAIPPEIWTCCVMPELSPADILALQTAAPWLRSVSLPKTCIVECPFKHCGTVMQISDAPRVIEACRRYLILELWPVPRDSFEILRNHTLHEDYKLILMSCTGCFEVYHRGHDFMVDCGSEIMLPISGLAYPRGCEECYCDIPCDDPLVRSYTGDNMFD